MLPQRCLTTFAFLLIATTAGAAEVDPYIPADTELVLSLNLQQVLSSPLGKQVVKPRIEAALKARPQLQAASLIVGLDVMKDITRVTAAMSGDSTDFAFLIVTGKFDRVRIGAVAEKVAADQKGQLRIHKNGTAPIYELVGDQSVFVSIPTDTTMLVTNQRARLKGDDQRGKAPRELVKLIETADSKQSVWLAALPGVTRIIPMLEEAQKLFLNQVVGVIGSFRIETRARMMLTLATRNASTALATGKALIDLLEMVRIFAPQLHEEPNLRPLIDMIGTTRVRAQGKSVSVGMEMSANQSESLLKLLSELIK